MSDPFTGFKSLPALTRDKNYLILLSCPRICRGPRSPMAETEDLKSFQCRFESDRGHHLTFGDVRALVKQLRAQQKS